MVKIDMEMPKSCCDCIFVQRNMLDGRWCGINNLKILDRDIRHPNCPLIECEEEEK